MPKLVDHRERRRQLIQATWTVLARVGFEGATMREIAREAGYTTGVLAHYFRNKEELLSAAIDATVEDAQHRRQNIVETFHGFDALRAVAIDLLPHGKASITRWAAWICYWGRGIGDAETAKAHFKHFRDSRDALAEMLEDAIARDEVRADIDAVYEADKIMGLVYGLAVHVLLNKMERDFPMKVLDDYFRTLVTK